MNSTAIYAFYLTLTLGLAGAFLEDMSLIAAAAASCLAMIFFVGTDLAGNRAQAKTRAELRDRYPDR